MDTSIEPEQHYAKHGYAVFRDQLSPALVADLTHEYRKVPETSYLLEPHFRSYRHVSQHSELFRSLALRGFFPQLAAALIGVPAVRLLFDQFIVKPAGVEGTPWHQDQPSLCFESFGICTFWIPLVDIRVGSGGVQFFHDDRRAKGPVDGIGLRVETTKQGLSAQSLPLVTGSFTVHDGWAIHRAEANATPNDRPAINLVYFDAGARVEALSGRDWRAARDKFFPGREPGDVADNCPVAG